MEIRQGRKQVRRRINDREFFSIRLLSGERIVIGLERAVSRQRGPRWELLLEAPSNLQLQRIETTVGDEKPFHNGQG